jgi:hypothetical protein
MADAAEIENCQIEVAALFGGGVCGWSVDDVKTTNSAAAPMSLVSPCPTKFNIQLSLFQIHALVARDSTILAEHQAGKRNFSQGRHFSKSSVIYLTYSAPATEKILSKIPPNDR